MILCRIAGAGGPYSKSGGIFLFTTEDEPISTVFFVRWPVERTLNAYYAVTTRHSIQEIVKVSFNLKKGGIDSQWFRSEDWVKHPSTDVAVLPLEMALDAYDINSVGVYMFAASREYVRSPPRKGRPVFPFLGSDVSVFGNLVPLIYVPGFGLPYGTGDEVFTIGLFEGHTGTRLNQPVARFGHIAMNPAPGEMVLAEIEPPDWTPTEALLVEMAAWNGQSGSPVYLRMSSNVDESSTSTIQPRRTPLSQPIYLVGMIQGFYAGKQKVKINDTEATLSPLQMGISIVIPAKDIIETLMQEALQEQRERLRKDNQQNPTIRP